MCKQRNEEEGKTKEKREEKFHNYLTGEEGER